MTKPFITLNNISKHFGGVRSLSDISLDILPGEVIGLAGENGSGKSTFIKVLAGVHAATSGSITVNGKEVGSYRAVDAVRAGIQIIFQDFSLFPNITVAENIALPNQVSSGHVLINASRQRAVAEAALKRLDVSIDLDERPENLSVADKQLVAIARALSNNAGLIVMDEPTTALTEKEIANLLGIVKRLKQDGVSVIFVSHKLQEMFEICDRFVVLRNGEKVAEGPVDAFDTGSLTRHITGRDIPEGAHISLPDGPGAELLRLDGLCRLKHFQDITFTLREREVVGIAGMLGSGRTELAKAIFGLARVDYGNIYVEGQKVRLASPMDAIRHRIAYVPEDRLTEGLFLDRSIFANVAAGLVDRYLSKLGLIKPASLHDTITYWLKRLAVRANPTLPVQALSGGNQQRVVLARALGQNPRVMILNGPSVGVDVGSKAAIHDIIKEFSVLGMGTLLISDDLAELLACCDRVLVMKGGRIVEDLANDNLSEQTLARRIAQ